MTLHTSSRTSEQDLAIERRREEKRREANPKDWGRMRRPLIGRASVGF